MRRVLPAISNWALFLLALSLLAIAAPTAAQAQSLGDVARQQRAERQNTTSTRVYTNDDVESPEAPIVKGKAASGESESTEAVAQPASTDAKAADAKPGEAATSEAKTADATTADAAKPSESADNAAGKKSDKKRSKADAAENAGTESAANAEETESSKAEKQKAQREKDIVERTKEVNDHYINRIKKLRDELNVARLQLTRIQSDQVANTQAYHNTAGMVPTLNEYEAQQREFIERIATQQDLIKTLEQQLSDAQEDARHAGVPHPYDY